MFNKILFIYSEKLSDKHLESVKKIEEIIRKKANLKKAKASDLQFNLFNVDLVVTAGGDGTFIRASHYIKNTPILGVNTEYEKSEGALTSVNENDVEKLKKIIKGNFKIIERQRIEIVRNGILLDKIALNDVYIGSENQFHTSKYEIIFKGKKEEQRSSGVLVASGSGSHAWYKSAGGSPFHYGEKKLKFLVREPYFGRLFKPEILKGEIKENEELEIISRRYQGGCITLDSSSTYYFNFGDRAKIKISRYPLKVLVPENWSLPLSKNISF